MNTPTLILVALRYQAVTGAEVRVHQFGDVVELVDQFSGVHSFLEDDAENGVIVVENRGETPVNISWVEETLAQVCPGTVVVRR